MSVIPRLLSSIATGSSAAALACLMVHICRSPLEAIEGPTSIFEEANKAYTEENYDDAISKYAECLETAESFSLHFNLGNSYYRAGDIGRTVLHYEKALALNPTNPDARANLGFVRSEAEVESPTYGLVTRFALLFSLQVWSWLTAGAFWVASTLLIVPRLFGGGNFTTRFLMFLCLMVFLTALVPLCGYHVKSVEGVVLVSDTPLRVAPTPDSPNSGYLQAGQIASVRKLHDGFLYIELAGGKAGYVTREEIGRIWD